MGGAADSPQRSSSPLKRRASSMDPEDAPDAKEDVDMISLPASENKNPSPEQEDEVTKTACSTASAEMDTQDPVASTTTELPLRNDIPPLEHQIKTIETLLKEYADSQVNEGDFVYLVSRQWLSKAQAFGGDTKHARKETPQGSLGPVDNSDIISSIFTDSIGQHCVKLKPGMGSENFELFPKGAWDLLVSWYGLAAGQSPIIRTAHNTAPDPASMPNIQFEFHPPVFTIHRLWSATSIIPIEQELKEKKPTPPVIVQSTSLGFHNFLKQAKTLTGVTADRKVRLWRILHTIPATETTVTAGGIKTPPDSPGRITEISTAPPTSPGAWPEMLVEVDAFLKLERDVERGLVDAEDTTTNPNYNGRKSLALVDLIVDQTLVIDELIERDSFVSTFKGSSHKDKVLASSGSSGSLAGQAKTSVLSGSGNPGLQGPAGGIRGRSKSGRTVGCVGLQNLGNTCYMNSALQCVRSVEELTKYFLTHEAQKEVNRDNPLSHNGDVAMAYGRLLEEIYKEPPPNSIAPRNFKNVIGRYAPAFSGYGQQDSQEFVGFLLDGLQEDLNRIKKKPYIEKPDSTDEMIGNDDLIKEMADKVWDITKKRDDSVIADLFTGMYKSTLECPSCEKVSITFDPFTNISLPLPIGSVWSHTVKFFPLNDRPVEISVELDKHSSIRALKQYISERVDVPVDRLFGAEEFRDRFFKYYDDMSSVSEEIQTNDFATLHELEAPPTNTTSLKKVKNTNKRFQDQTSTQLDDSMAERLMVPVVHRMNPEDPQVQKQRWKSKDQHFPPPHFIILTPDEARKEEVIRRKILEKVATYTTWPEFSNVDESDTAETTDPEMVNTVSDVDSGDSKVVAKSVEGEEDLVDVSMRDAPGGQNAATSAPAKEAPPLLRKFNKRRPKWIDPLEFLDPRFQNLFELSYFVETGSSTSVPIGWNVVTEDNTWPRLSTRQIIPVVSDVEMRTTGVPWDGSDESGSDEASGHTPVDTQLLTRMTEESSEEEEDFPKAKNLPPRSNGPHGKNQPNARGKNKKMKTYRTYGKKARKRFEKERRAALAQQQQQQGRQERQSFEMSSQVDYGADGDDGRLVRLNEGIVVEWNEAAYDTLFGGTSPTDDYRGVKTYMNPDKLEDPAIEVDRKKRAMRKKHGLHLDDCLKEFGRKETLSEQDMWFCPRCKEFRRAQKKFDLWKSPDILIIHLKRFSSSSYRRDKLDIQIEFPIEGLDLTSRVLDNREGKQEIFDLIAVDDHWGGLGGGHYTAFAKNFIDGEWYEYNDASVTKQKDLSRMVTSAAYLLFYRRRSDKPLGGPRFQEIFEHFDRERNSADDDNSNNMMLDSGEGQRLGQGSSHRGSPSALTGAGLVPLQGSRGLASGSGGPTTSSSSNNGVRLLATNDDDTTELLPSYQDASMEQGDVGGGGLLDDDTDMGAQLSWANQHQDQLHNSIEGDDEGIVLDNEFDNSGSAAAMPGMTSVIGTNTWSFNNIVGNPGSAAGDDDEGDLDSNVADADGNSSALDDFADDMEMMGMTAVMSVEPGTGYDEPEEPQRPTQQPEDEKFLGFDDMPMREPSVQEQDHMGQLAAQAWDRSEQHQQLHTVPPAEAQLLLDGDEDGDSDKVAEIHVEEDEDTDVAHKKTQ